MAFAVVAMKSGLGVCSSQGLSRSSGLFVRCHRHEKVTAYFQYNLLSCSWIDQLQSDFGVGEPALRVRTPGAGLPADFMYNIASELDWYSLCLSWRKMWPAMCWVRSRCDTIERNKCWSICAAYLARHGYSHTMSSFLQECTCLPSNTTMMVNAVV